MDNKSILNHPEPMGQAGKVMSRLDDAMHVLAVIVAGGILKDRLRHKNESGAENYLSEPSTDQ
jgi:hypothetical protein